MMPLRASCATTTLNRECNVFADAELSKNDFLGGALTLWQPVRGYRAGIDPVLLAAAVPAVAGQTVLDLGCGAGAAALCLGARVSGLCLHGVEVQADYATLATRNGDHNNQNFTIWNNDLAEMPTALRNMQFDHVIANPPYFRSGGHSPSPNVGRARAMGEIDRSLPLGEWITAAAKRLRNKGYLHIIQRAERLPELLAGFAGQLGSIEVLPIAARIGRAPENVILRARKGGRAGFVLHAPLILHDGAMHVHDGDDYRPEIAQILRHAAPISWPNRR